MRKKFFSTLLALCMILTLVPVTAWAAEEDAATGLPKLSNPTNLSWGNNTWDIPGTACWDMTGTYQSRYLFSIYKVGETTTQAFVVVEEPADAQHTNYSDNYFFTRWASGDPTVEEFETGDYYFTVKKLGDGIKYADSDEVSSETAENGIYHYVKPENKLPTLDAGTWNWPASIWNDERTDHMRTFDVDYGFSATENGPIKYIGGANMEKSGIEADWLQNKLIGENGDGYYYFRVRALSSNLAEMRSGDFSEWSEAYNLGVASAGIKDKLEDLTDKDAEAIISGVQGLNRTELMNAMHADLKNDQNGTIDALAALEAKVGGPAGVTIADDETLQSTFTEDTVSVVGASLNNKSNANNPITLNIGRAEPKDIRDELYNSTVAVNFSMELDNAAQPSGQLAVPVKITLPIPSNINPEFLAILHYHQDGSHEQIEINTYQDRNGKWFASFVLDSFSDFVMTELKGAPPVTPEDPEPDAEIPLVNYTRSSDFTSSADKQTYFGGKLEIKNPTAEDKVYIVALSDGRTVNGKTLSITYAISVEAGQTYVMPCQNMLNLKIYQIAEGTDLTSNPDIGEPLVDKAVTACNDSLA